VKRDETNESDSSSAGVVQLKEKKEGFFSFFLRVVREERREGSH